MKICWLERANLAHPDQVKSYLSWTQLIDWVCWRVQRSLELWSGINYRMIIASLCKYSASSVCFHQKGTQHRVWCYLSCDCPLKRSLFFFCPLIYSLDVCIWISLWILISLQEVCLIASCGPFTRSTATIITRPDSE